MRCRPNSLAPLTDNWKVTDNSSVNFHDMFFFIFCYNLAKNEEKHIMKLTDESSITFQSSVSGPGEFGQYKNNFTFYVLVDSNP